MNTYRFLILLILYSLCFGQNPDKKVIKVFIRVDDIFMKESNIYPQEIDEFIKVAEKYNAHVQLAVIPGRLLSSTTNPNSLMTLQLIDYSRRGHQIVQHGYNHRCPFTSSTSWEFYTPDIKGFTQQEMLSLIREGKHILEAITGNLVTTYVGPGYDNDSVLVKNEKEMKELGFTWLTDQNTNFPYIKDNQGYFFPLEDYAWALSEENYQIKMEEAKTAFLNAVKNCNFWGFLFHDHFTRKNYNQGITIKWFDEFMGFLTNLSEYQIEFLTPDEFYNQQIKN